MPTKPLRSCAIPECPEKALANRTRCRPHEYERIKEAYDRARRGKPGRVYYNSKAWRLLRLLVLHRDPVCRVCGLRPSTDVDHVVMREDGGGDSEDNLQGLCHSCHSVKTARETKFRRR